MAARKIRITKAPFDYRWPSGAISCFGFNANGTEPMLKGEVADWIIAKGYGEELAKPRARRSAPKAKKAVAKAEDVGDSAADASAADIREDSPMDAAHDDENGAVENGRALDNSSGER